MADHNSSVASHLAELYNEIDHYKQEIEAAKAVVKEKEDALEKAKGKFANYLKAEDIYSLIAPTNASAKAAAKTSTPKPEGSTRKPRSSSDDKLAEVERNKATYTGEYPLGINEKTGLPNRYKGKSSKNLEIDAQMVDDKRNYKGGANHEEEAVAQESPAATAPKPAAKKAKAAAH